MTEQETAQTRQKSSSFLSPTVRGSGDGPAPVNEGEWSVFNRILLEGTRDAVLTGLVLTGATYLAQKRYPPIRSLTLQVKTFIISSLSVAAGAFSVDKRLSYDYFKNLGHDKVLVYQPMTWKEWAFHHRLKIFGGTLLAAIAGGFALNKKGSVDGFTRVMNIRLFSQGLTIVTVLGFISLLSADPSQYRDQSRFQPPRVHPSVQKNDSATK